jgi:hypothetical protein
LRIHRWGWIAWHVALTMHESMKRNGLRKEAGKIICKEENEIKEIKEEGVDQVNYEEVLRMDYLLRDGFVGYLAFQNRFKKINFFIFLLQINIFLVFSNHFNVLMSKIIF